MAEVEAMPTFGAELKVSIPPSVRSLQSRQIARYFTSTSAISPPTYTDLSHQDGFKGANAWVGHGIAWLEDIQQFYRERAAIEKEYSAKLAALAKKHFDKKNKKTSQLSVGDTPSLTPGSLER